MQLFKRHYYDQGSIQLATDLAFLHSVALSGSTGVVVSGADGGVVSAETSLVHFHHESFKNFVHRRELSGAENRFSGKKTRILL